MNNSYYPVQHTQTTPALVPASPHNRWVIFFLALFLGSLGVHRFAVGKIWTGLLMLATGGGFGFWWAFDVFMILIGNFTDSNGLRLGGAVTHQHDRQLTHQVNQQPRQFQPAQQQYPQQGQGQQSYRYGPPGGEDGDLDFVMDDDPLAQKFVELEKEMRRKREPVE